ncbi:type III polyketide synthase [Nocardia cyriacigeorgica]|uniref:Type III polyketide synthase n=1 Tax=Nocardia cyriacigeorgica TaxID=135487 RepID=A0A6P1DBN0_9NOCA|nr:3-oxoacyl-[acyl-carrier-protein] synthase III C-terminal domain-containing protein [Nocardia cyriacigeorgica]NEW38700.1 type III polyketide synthase [Nocardia cyriacigeorgica]NEW48165.1 type III polyketide synthase [Nocardia cyriacigeorgica]NEW59450.1 type III polyketide synthase [Nocardia cyriacigeorgica]
MALALDQELFTRTVAHSRERTTPPSSPAAVPVIEAIATGAPGLVLDQTDAADWIAGQFTDPEQQTWIRRLFGKTMINTRRFAVDPLDSRPHAPSGTPARIQDRMQLFYRHAVPLAVDVARRALDGVDPADVGLLVFATSTGLIAPGVDVAVVNDLGLPRSVARLVVNFMGCAAAMNGIRTASDFVRANPHKKALVVCIELNSVHVGPVEDLNDVVSYSLFGDGCGAVVIGANRGAEPADAGTIVIRDHFTHLFEGTEDGIAVGVGHDAITCELSENVPRYIYDGVAPVVGEVLHRNELSQSDINVWAIHPGGPKILLESARSLDLPPEAASTSWDVLGEYGNMSSVSLIFVLERIANRTGADEPTSTGVAFSFAPGITMEGFVFDVVPG